MAKLVLDDIANLQNEASATSKMNKNSALIEAAIENTLSRDGSLPNAMRANFDMNSHRILNLPAPLADQEPVRLVDVADASVTIAQGFLDEMEDLVESINDVVISGNRYVADLPTMEVTTVSVDQQLMYIAGYYEEGDHGGAWYKRVASEPSHPAKVRSTDRFLPNGSEDNTNGGWWVLNEKVVNQYMFGAIDDNTTDCREFLQNMIDYAINIGAKVQMQPGWHNVSVAPGEDYCLLINYPIHFTGAGLSRTFIDPDGVADNKDVISVNMIPAVSIGLTDGLYMADFWIGTPATALRGGRHGINIDTQAVGAYVSRSVIERIYLNPPDAAGAAAILITNNATNNPNGGYTTSTVRNCFLGSGVRAVNIGDSVNFIENTISGAGNGLDITQVTFAGNLLIDANNITSDGAAIVIYQARNPKIINNNIENFTGAGSENGAIVDMNVLGTACGNLEFSNNNVAAITGTTVSKVLRLYNCIAPNVHNNCFGSGAISGIVGITIDASTAFAKIGGDNIFHPSFTTIISDSGVATRGVVKALTLGSGVANIGGNADSSYMITCEGEVLINLCVSATNPSGDNIATIPGEIWPVTNIPITATGDVAGTLSAAYIDITAAGNLVFRGSDTVTKIVAAGSYKLPPIVFSV